jgi:hypothetical protein
MNVIYPYCKGALFDIINVITWLHMQLIDSCYMIAKNMPKTPRQKPAKNPLKIPHQQKSAWITQKSSKNI